MSLWQNCKCKACGHEWQYELFSIYNTYRNDYHTQYCDRCKVILENEKRKKYFEGNSDNDELQDYRYALECIANSDSWLVDDNPLCSVDSVYNRCVDMAVNILNKYDLK